MNTKTPKSDKNKIPLLIRSAQWTVAERTENQVSAVCLKNKQDEMIVQQICIRCCAYPTRNRKDWAI